MARAHVSMALVTNIIMVIGINAKLSLVIVIGRLGNGSEFAWIERHDPMSVFT